MRSEVFFVLALAALAAGCRAEAHGATSNPNPSASAAAPAASAPASPAASAGPEGPGADSGQGPAGAGPDGRRAAADNGGSATGAGPDGRRAAADNGGSATGAGPDGRRAAADNGGSGKEPPQGGACGEGEVFIPPTPKEGFTMGRGDRGETDRPHRVVLTHGFCMDSTEVTVRAYKACVDAGACKVPYLADPYSTYPRFPEYPVTMVNWEKSRGYCAWAGKRLPTEAEWEWAATGPDGTKYPWGNGPEPVCGAELADFTPFGAPKSNPGGDVGCFGGGPSAVKAHPRGAKRWPGGELYDLAGNVWEWTEDSYAPYDTRDQVDPLVRLVSLNHAIRGGGWNRPARALQGWFRGSAIRSYQVPGLGFRCVRGAPHPTQPLL